MWICHHMISLLLTYLLQTRLILFVESVGLKTTLKFYTDMDLSVWRNLLMINMHCWCYYPYSWCQFYICWYRLHHIHHHSGLYSYLLSEIQWFTCINHLAVHSYYISKLLLQWVLKAILINFSIYNIPPLVGICHVHTSLHLSYILLLYT